MTGSGKPPNLDFNPSQSKSSDKETSQSDRRDEDEVSGDNNKVIGPRRGSPTVTPEKYDFSDYYKRKFKPDEYLDRYNTRKKFFPLTKFLYKELTFFFQATFKIKLQFPDPNEILFKLIKKAFDAQIAYLDETISLILEKKDPLFLSKLSAGEENPIVKPTSLENVKKQVIQQYERFLNDRETLNLMEMLEANFAQINDNRLYYRLGFWQLLLLGGVLEYWQHHPELVHHSDSPVLYALDDLLSDVKVFRRTAGVMLLFGFLLFKNIPDFLLSWNRILLKANVSNDGYLMQAWVKYRYNCTALKDMKYENYFAYFFNSLGSIHGRTPEFDGGPKEGLHTWLNTTLLELERKLSEYPLFREEDRPQLLEEMLLQLNTYLTNELVLREFDDEGRLINQPPYSDNVFDFIAWLMELASNRDTLTNVPMIKSGKKRVELNQEMFRFISYAIQNINEKGEKIIQPWF